MNKFFLLIVIFIQITVSNISIFSQFSGGLGTEIDPYRISRREDMEELADSVRNVFVASSRNWSSKKYFIVTNDITDSVRTVIGVWDPNNMNTQFCGHFDGQGYKITVAITFDFNQTVVLGLFGQVRSCVIKNVVVDGYVSGVSSIPFALDASSGAGIVGDIRTSSSSAWNFDPYVTISNCVNNANITLGRMVGGVVGDVSVSYRDGVGEIISCYNNGKILGVSQTAQFGIGAGGIAGNVLVNTTTSNCINNGDVVISKNGLGGIAGGSHYNNNIFSNNLNNGSILGCEAGGIVGNADMGQIYNNINYGFVKGDNIIGGVVGISRSAAIINNSNFGVVVGDSETGCIIGRVGGIIINNHYDKQMCGEEE